MEEIRKLKVGIAVPCHYDDMELYKTLHRSIKSLNPQPYKVLVKFNHGEGGLKSIVSSLFEKLFDSGCDVVLKASADFFLFQHILSYVEEDRLVTFTPLNLQPFIFWATLHRLLVPNRTWTGCYAIPRRLWLQVKDSFNGSDSSIAQAAKHWKVKSFQYRLMRPYREDTTMKLLMGMPLSKRLFWQWTRLKVMVK